MYVRTQMNGPGDEDEEDDAEEDPVNTASQN